MSRRIDEAVFVEAPARLHFGVLENDTFIKHRISAPR